MEAETRLEAEEMGISPSWGTGRRGWGMGTTTAAIMKWEMATGIELWGGSEPRPSLLKTCE